MRDLTRRFLNPKEKKQVEAAVGAAEKRTSGEIVCLIVSSSYDYPMADVIGATACALPLSLVLTPAAGARLWFGTHNMWLFLGIFTVLFILFMIAVRHIPALKRLFISRKEIREEVEEAAITNFFRHGLHRTRESNGILLFISVLEHAVWILADQNINAKVAEGHWDAIVARLTEGIRRGQPAGAICRAVNMIGEELKHHFPARTDDADELKNVIIEHKDSEF